MTDPSTEVPRRLELPVLRVLAAIGVVALAFGAAEVGCRVAGHDFGRASFEQLPRGYVPPDLHEGTALRRRDTRPWTGQPRRTLLRLQGYDDASLADEPEVRVEFDAKGFRNPRDLRDWRVAVAGDELTDQPDQPTEELFTSHLAQRLGAPVKNLAAACNSTCNEVEYLRQWGVAPGCTTWIVVFFEGDDLLQLPCEVLVRQGLAPQRSHHVSQPSATEAFLGAVLRGPFSRPCEPTNAHLLGEGALDRPVWLEHSPPSTRSLGAPLRALFEASLHEYRAAATAARVEPWLAYMPAKERIYHGLGRLELEPVPAPIANWRPTDLPGWVAEVCGRAGVRFVDLTPDLAAVAARREELPFQDIGRTLTRTGSRCVADALARALGGPGGPAPVTPPGR